MWALTNQPADRIKCWDCVQRKFVCIYTFVAVQMSGNSATIGQTQVHRQGPSCERLVCAAASHRCHDLVLRPTAGKTEFKTEHISQPVGKQTCPGNKDGNRVTRQCWTRVCGEQSSPGANARPRSLPGWVSLGVRLRLAAVCAHTMCVCVLLASSQLSPCSARSPCACVRVCEAPGGSRSLLTIRQRRQRQIRVWLVPSLVNGTKPVLIPEQIHCLQGEGGRVGGRRECNLWSVCL